jgi:hypothetical protein
VFQSKLLTLNSISPRDRFQPLRSLNCFVGALDDRSCLRTKLIHVKKETNLYLGFASKENLFRLNFVEVLTPKTTQPLTEAFIQMPYVHSNMVVELLIHQVLETFRQTFTIIC